MATFRCKLSGNTVSFHVEQDIKDMRRDEGYTEVISPEPQEIKVIPPEYQEIKATPEPDRPVLSVKKRGRPPKGDK